jgi:hypothetical protein
MGIFLSPSVYLFERSTGDYLRSVRTTAFTPSMITEVQPAEDGESPSLVVASDTKRTALVVVAHPDNESWIYLGFDSSVSSHNYAAVLVPGGSASFSYYTGALYAVCVSAGDKVGGYQL